MRGSLRGGRSLGDQMGWDGPMSWPTPDRLPLFAMAALLSIALVGSADLAALPRIAIRNLVLARLRAVTVARVAGVVLALALTLTALLLSAGIL